MPFNADRFEAAPARPRTRRVPVDALAAFFDAGAPAEWEVRGLNSNELHRAIEAGRRNGVIDTILKGISPTAEQVAALRAAIGLTADTPGEIAKRVEMLVLGSVAPAPVSHATAAKLAETFPIEFLTLTNAITELTGLGFDLGKPAPASPQTPASSPACDSPSSEAGTSTTAGPT